MNSCKENKIIRKSYQPKKKIFGGIKSKFRWKQSKVQMKIEVFWGQYQRPECFVRKKIQLLRKQKWRDSEYRKACLIQFRIDYQNICGIRKKKGKTPPHLLRWAGGGGLISILSGSVPCSTKKKCHESANILFITIYSYL